MNKSKITAPVVAGMGEVLWDNLPGGRRLGGAPANFACHARALGASAMIISAVGRDEAGAELRAAIKGKGVEDRCLATDADHPTGVVNVELDAEGHPSYRIADDCAWDYWRMTTEVRAAVAGLDAVCFGTLAQRNQTARTSIREALEYVDRDCLRVFDVNLRQNYFDEAILYDSFRMANVFKISSEELPVVAQLLNLPGNSELAGLRALQQKYSPILIVLTRGSRGSLLLDQAGSDEHPGIKIRAIDTVGAGDSFTAAVVMGLLRKCALPEINHMANRLAAYVCSCVGATPELPGDFARWQC